MHQRGFASIVIIAVAVVLAAIIAALGVWRYKTRPQGISSSLPTSQNSNALLAESTSSSIETTSIALSADGKTYTLKNSLYGFEFRYPTSWGTPTSTDDHEYDYLFGRDNPKSNSAGEILLAKYDLYDIFNGTFGVYIHKNISNATDCHQINDPPGNQTTQTINGNVYNESFGMSDEEGMQGVSDSDRLFTFKNGICYEFDFVGQGGLTSLDGTYIEPSDVIKKIEDAVIPLVIFSKPI